ncbi:hypothetical protein ASF61_07330 [Duganella sp. Leaf126]|uniref:hypothetical protein n=1 Tax=Duganella sp. Leaf126 TaxID=1736266 RepID=UPI000702131F|nr:hypothetical protein [Duganella sp. Leaf126]KQQ36015.1 hypothetical protein ASF61_07330 [Duganella sp. Leaf126]
MSEQSASSILRRAGAVLLVLCACDLAWMAWRVAGGAAHSAQWVYSLAMIVPAMVCAAFLLRASLRAAALLVWIASVLLPLALAMAALTLLQPPDLTLTQWRLDPGAQLAVLLPVVLFCAALFWLRTALLRQPVRAAMVVSGRRPPADHLALGAGVVLALLALGGHQLGRDAGLLRKAEFLARAKHGEQYRYHVSKLTPRDDMEGTFVEAQVLAWRADRIDTVDVFWKEK